MIIGDTSRFAIESGVTRAYERLSFRGLGYFAFHIGGRRFGVCEPDATLLACALDRVEERLARRGTHTAPFGHAPAAEIVDAILDAIYNPEPRADSFFDLSMSEFSDAVHSSRCEWHPGFDEAFDDGSGIRHFDIGDRVRLIADRNQKSPFDWRHDAESLTDIWISAAFFYGVLEDWRDAFLAEWQSASKSRRKKMERNQH
jgi:hypothetical protein